MEIRKESENEPIWPGGGEIALVWETPSLLSHATPRPVWPSTCNVWFGQVGELEELSSLPDGFTAFQVPHPYGALYRSSNMLISRSHTRTATGSSSGQTHSNADPGMTNLRLQSAHAPPRTMTHDDMQCVGKGLICLPTAAEGQYRSAR